MFSKPVDGAVPPASSGTCHIKEPEEGEDSDFEMLMKSAHRHTGSRDELNQKDHAQEKPSRLKQRSVHCNSW